MLVQLAVFKKNNLNKVHNLLKWMREFLAANVSTWDYNNPLFPYNRKHYLKQYKSGNQDAECVWKKEGLSRW